MGVPNHERLSVKHEILGQPAFSTTEISQLLGVTMTAKFIENVLGVPPDEKTPTARLWLRARFPHICHMLSRRVMGMGFYFMEDSDES